MKDKSGSRIGRMLKNIFRVRSWIDFDRVKQGMRYIKQTCATYFIPQEKTTKESFNEAKIRLHLTDQQLLLQQKSLLRLVVLLLIVAFFLFVYFIYNLIYNNFTAVLINATVMMLALVLAFRYHFWYFQIKQQILGCTFKKWFWQGLMGVPTDE